MEPLDPPGHSKAFWSRPAAGLLRELDTGQEGLSTMEAERRLRSHGPNSLTPPARGGTAVLLLSQFTSPIILILAAAALCSRFCWIPR